MRYLLIWMLCLGTLMMTACTTEKVVVQYKYEVLCPEKQVVPTTPALQFYNSSDSIDSPSNFRKFQENQLMLTDYIISLKSVISGYEKSIDVINSKKAEIEKRNTK